MTNPLHIHLRDRLNTQTLAGRLSGERDRAVFEELVRKSVAAAVVIDFEGVQVVTSSYFLAGMWPLWNDRGDREVYPILANVSDDIREDIVLPVRSCKAAVWMGTWTGAQYDAPKVVGELDVELRHTVSLAVEQTQVTATTLYDLDTQPEDRRVQKTAWNNRLAALHQLRLLHRYKASRQLVYAVPWRL